MRLISLLIGLVIIAYIISVQLSPKLSSNAGNATIDNQNIAVPNVPTVPGGLEKFETDINGFIQDAASAKDAQLEKIENSIGR